MPIRIQDISRDLGISVSTVSKALNDYPDVSEETRQLILQKAQEMGYQASATARNLRRGRTDKIGLFINHSLSYISEYLAEIIAGVALTSELSGKNIILYTETINKPDELLRICRAGEIDGALLLWANPPDETLSLLEQENMPYVVLGRRVDYPTASYVAPDNAHGAYLVTRHLIECGHRRIGFMSRPIHGPTNLDRLAGYTSALQEHGLDIDKGLIVPTAMEPDSGYHAMNALLDMAERPTAVFAFYDLLAIDAMRAVFDRDMRVPDDMAVVGFDGLRSSLITTPTLTTIEQPLVEMGRRAVNVLIAQLNNPHLPSERITLPVRLIVRNSSS